MGSATRHHLTVVSNRGPVLHEVVDGERVALRSGGGLVTALRGLLGAHDVVWVANAISDEDRRVAREQRGRPMVEEDELGHPFRLHLAIPDPDDFRRAYHEIANPLLWFLQHGLHGLGRSPIVTARTRAAWGAYRRCNATVAAAAAAEREGQALMIHDYQLYLTPALLRAAGVRMPMLHFTHIPWPGPDAWRILPVDLRTELLHGLLGSDIVGFHTERDVDAFLATCREHLPGVEVDDDLRGVRVVADRRWREVRVRAYPISIDPAGLRALEDVPAMRDAAAELERTGPEILILRVERTDPSKNVVRGLHALDRLLERRPDLRGRVTMLTLLDPSRLAIPEYENYLRTIESTAAEVNERHGRDGWLPIDLRVGDNFPMVIAAYRRYDVLFVNAIADGMNLVAKEGPLLNDRDGVLVLSERAGAHEQLAPFALGVEPLDIEQTAAQLERAIDLPAGERARRARDLRAFVEAHDVARWIDAQIDDLDELAAAR
jgi:trehalose 6-phosphate synthase